MSLRSLVLALAALTLVAHAGTAQSAPIRPLRPAASALFRPPTLTAPSDSLHLPRTYAKTGALIVGIPSAIFGAALGTGLCGMDGSSGKNCTMSALAFGAVLGGVGAITGALIGGQFERQ